MAARARRHGRRAVLLGEHRRRLLALPAGPHLGPKITLWTALGGALPAVVITVFGVAAATATDMTDPVAGLEAILPNWFFVTYLAIIVGGTITNNFLNSLLLGHEPPVPGLKAKRGRRC